MKKSTKNKIIVLFVILILFSSSIAFIIMGVYNFGTTQQKAKTLDNPVVKGEIDQETELSYIKSGYTFLKFYYKNDTQFLGYVETMPAMFKTNNGIYQLFVQEIQSENEYAIASSAKNVVEIYNLTETALFSAACETVSFRPAECIIGTILNTTI